MKNRAERKSYIKAIDSLILIFLFTKNIGYGAELLNIGSINFNNGGVEELLASASNILLINKKIEGELRLELNNSNTEMIGITNNGHILPTGNKNGIYFDTRNSDGTTIDSRDISLNELKNNGIILAKESLEIPVDQIQSGNGVFIFNSTHMLSAKSFVNNGLISGHYVSSIDKSNSGNGAVLFGKKGVIDKFQNEGIIKGEASQSFLKSNFGNGVYIDLEVVSLIKNNGLILGRADYSNINMFQANAGYGMFLATKVGSFENTGIIEGYLEHSSSLGGAGIKANSISDFKNTGIIIGKTGTGVAAETGTNDYGIGVDLGTVLGQSYAENTGVIGGYQLNTTTSGYAGNGISLSLDSDKSEKQEIKNEGIVFGYEGAERFISGISNPTSGNGIIVKNEKAEFYLENSGTISSYNSLGEVPFYINPAGVSLSTINSLNSAILNNGIIKSNISAITINAFSGKSEITNNGILAGNYIVTAEKGSSLNNIITNNGIFIYLNEEGKIENIENGLGGNIILEDGIIKEIINAAISDFDSFIVIKDSKYENKIINGAGMNKGALIVKENSETTLSNSIINGYNTALYLENNSKIIATNTTFNGGGVKNDVAVIKGDDGDNSLNILGNSIINGAVDLGNGTDTLTLANIVQINGNLDGGIGSLDTLNLGEEQTAKAIDSPNLNILHDIKGFENINTNGNLILFETTNVTGAENITLESGNLVLRVDPTITMDGKITGHALYGNNGTLTSNGGNLVIGLNGLGEGAIISMGGTTITPETNDHWWQDTDSVKTNSLVLDGKLSVDGKDINITVLESIPLEPSIPPPPINPEPPVDPEPPIVVDSLLYEKLNKVYQSIVTAGEIGTLANTTLLEDKTYDESLGGLLTILDQVYANNPYAYTLKSSRDSLKLFEDSMSYLTIKPKKDEMIVQGKAIYTGVKNDSSASGKNYHGFDTGHRNYKTTTNTVGGLATFEYGLSDDTSLGFVFGGNNQDVNFKGSSKIKGNSLYLGTFAKTDINNFKFMSGVGYQYTSADVDRKVSNKYDSFSTGDKYDINSLNAFVEAKYVYNAEQDWTVEPKVRLSYYYIDQDKVNEGYTPGQISMKTDKVNSNTADVKIGVDFVKSLYLNNGKLKNILSLGVINTIGDKSKELNGYILGKEKDGKKFDIQGVELPKTSGKVSYNLELEQTNGMVYTTGVSLEFAKDYNRNVSATVGIGYKF